MLIAPTYAEDGLEVINWDAPKLLDDAETINGIVLAIRSRVRDQYLGIVGQEPTWTRGTWNSLGATDYVYASWVTDVRQHIWDIENELGIAYTVWSTSSIVHRYDANGVEVESESFTDARKVSIWNELTTAMDRIDAVMGGVLPPAYAVVKWQGTETVVGD